MSSTHKKPSELFDEEKMMWDILAKNNEGWEKRFDYKFPDGLFGVEWYSNRSFKCCWSETLDVKSFIRSERLLALKEERTRIAGMVSEMKKDVKDMHPDATLNPLDEITAFYVEEKNGYNQALSDIAARLESEGSLEDKG